MEIATKMPALLTAMALLTSVNIAVAEPSLWVAADRVARHTCPSVKCGVAGQLMFREGVEVLETKGAWVRVTKPYSASCSGGFSEYVKSGNSACVASNGINNGMFAEWVPTKSLTKDRPADPGEGASGDDVLVKNSDDYPLYRTQFTKATREFIDTAPAPPVTSKKSVGGWHRLSKVKVCISCTAAA